MFWIVRKGGAGIIWRSPRLQDALKEIKAVEARFPENEYELWEVERVYPEPDNKAGDVKHPEWKDTQDKAAETAKASGVRVSDSPSGVGWTDKPSSEDKPE